MLLFPEVDTKCLRDKGDESSQCLVSSFLDRYKGRFELTYVSLSQVIVKRLSSGSRIVLKSHFACEISRVNIYQDRQARSNGGDGSDNRFHKHGLPQLSDGTSLLPQPDKNNVKLTNLTPPRFVVANTTETLLLGDLETLKLSEIPWQARGGGAGGGVSGGAGGDASSAAPVEKFIFDSPSAALVYHASELSIIEYGRNEVKRGIECSSCTISNFPTHPTLTARKSTEAFCGTRYVA